MPTRVIYTVKESWNWNIILFPGVVFHELSHFVMSLLMGFRVTGGRFWGERDAAIEHEVEPGLRAYLASAAPFLFGTAAAVLFILLAQTAARSLAFSSAWQSWLQVLVLYYLGLSIAAHCFPSSKDADNALNNLSTGYFGGMSRWPGALFYIITFIPLFIPLYFAGMLMRAFATVRNLGFLWFVILFWLAALL